MIYLFKLYNCYYRLKFYEKDKKFELIEIYYNRKPSSDTFDLYFSEYIEFGDNYGYCIADDIYLMIRKAHKSEYNKYFSVTKNFLKVRYSKEYNLYNNLKLI